jgi:hypothetical protein
VHDAEMLAFNGRYFLFLAHDRNNTSPLVSSEVGKLVIKLVVTLVVTQVVTLVVMLRFLCLAHNRNNTGPLVSSSKVLRSSAELKNIITLTNP